MTQESLTVRSFQMRLVFTFSDDDLAKTLRHCTSDRLAAFGAEFRTTSKLICP
jgi:hypothetical protein